MIYLYAITEPPASDPEWRGLEDQQVRMLRSDQLAAIYSAHEALDPSPAPQMLWRHDEVVEAAMRCGATLPVRFGTTLADTDDLAEVLSREGTALRRALEAVRGCVELAVRVRLPNPSDPVPQDGREYVHSRLSRRRQRAAVVDQTLAPLAQIAMRARHQPNSLKSEELTASYLIREQDVARFADEVRVLQQRNPELSLSCTGPWAPYSFTEMEQAA